MRQKAKKAEKRLEIALWKIIRRLDSDPKYNYPEAVRDAKRIFGRKVRRKVGGKT